MSFGNKGLSREIPPKEPEALVAYLSRMFNQVGNLLQRSHEYTERREMPGRPQVGDVYYFGNPATHSYDAAITSEGWWGYKSTGWTLIA